MVEVERPTARHAVAIRVIVAVACGVVGTVVFLVGVGLIAVGRGGGDAPRLPLAAGAAVVAMVAGGLALAAGIGVLVFNWGPWRSHPLFPPGSHRSIIGTTILAVVLAALAAVVYFGAVPDAHLESTLGFIVLAFSLHVALSAMIYLQGMRAGLVSVRSLGLAGPLVWRGAPSGLVAAAALLALSIANGLVLRALGIPQPQAQALLWLRDVPLPQYLLVAGAGTLVAPMVEELFFRGYVFNAYAAAKGRTTAYVASAAIFGLLHGHVALFPAIFVGGLILAYSYRRTGTIAAPVIAHIVNNGVAFGSLLVGGDI